MPAHFAPKKAPLYQYYMKLPTHKPKVTAEYDATWPTSGQPTSNSLHFRNKCAETMLSQESQEFQDALGLEQYTVHEEALRKHKEATVGLPSTDASDREE
jgi:hypothetical protein